MPFTYHLRYIQSIVTVCEIIQKHNILKQLSATLAKSGPLDLPSEKSSLLFFAHEKGLGHMFKK